MQKKSEIIPAVLEKKKSALKEKLHLISAKSEIAQVDVLDGAFAAKISWPYSASFFEHLLKSFSLKAPLPLELHLMIKYNMDFAERFGLLGAKRVSAQIESEDFEEFLKAREKLQIEEFGASIMLETDSALLEPFLSRLDFVQFMCISPIGVQGSTFKNEVLSKISEFKEKHADMTIAVDGGVSLSNIESLHKAGARRFAVGSAIFKSEDPLCALQKFKEKLMQLDLQNEV